MHITQTITFEEALERFQESFTKEEATELFNELFRAALADGYCITKYSPGYLLEFTELVCHLISTVDQDQYLEIFKHSTAVDLVYTMFKVLKAAQSEYSLVQLTQPDEAFAKVEAIKSWSLKLLL